MDKLKNLIVLFVLINTQLIGAQQTISLDETVFLHTNASTFVTGETLLYKMYCLKVTDKKASIISKIGYVELVDSNHKSVFKTKIKLENSIGQGEYFIPTTLKTGTYKLIGYTNWMLNKPIDELFQINISIINPFIANQANTEVTKTDNGTIAITKEKTETAIYTNENLKFKLDKKVFSNRELVNLQLEASDENFSEGNYSLSVRKIEELTFEEPIRTVDFLIKGTPTIIDITKKEKEVILPELRGEVISGKVTAKNGMDKVENIAVAFSLTGQSDVFQISKTDSNGNFNFKNNKNNSNVVIQIIDNRADNYTFSLDKSPQIDHSKSSNEKKIILPELRGEMLTGKVTAKNNTDKVENIAVAFSLPGKSEIFQVSKTDSKGNFIFNFNSTDYNPNVILQIIDDRADNYTLSLDKSSEIEYDKLAFEPANNLSYEYKERLLNRSISSQIENAYFYKKTDSFIKPVYSQPFYSVFSKEYILDNYTRFKTINETITEVATEIYSRKTKDTFYLHVMDYTIPEQQPESALVLFDGLLIQNQIELLNYNMKKVYKINLVSGRYYVGPKSFNGLISFTSFENDFENKQNGSYILKTSILRPQPKKLYYKINYSNPSENETIPDFRNQLFWNPDVKTNENANNTFYTSDLAGRYEIRLEGFAKNGLAVSINEIIEVNDLNVN